MHSLAPTPHFILKFNCHSSFANAAVASKHPLGAVQVEICAKRDELFRLIMQSTKGSGFCMRVIPCANAVCSLGLRFTQLKWQLLVSVWSCLPKQFFQNDTNIIVLAIRIKNRENATAAQLAD